MSKNSNIQLSIVIPIYNEQGIIPELVDRLESVKVQIRKDLQISPDKVEVILVNDGSKDNSFSVMRSISETTAGYRLVNLSRNYGHQLATTAGIDVSRGQAVVVMDGDLQDPPEFIIELYRKMLEGYDVVYARRKKRPGESIFKLATAKIFYRILKKITSFDIPLDTGDFRIMSRRVVDVLCSMRESHRYIRGLISWIGFQQTGIEYERAERFEGSTKFSIGKMIKFAVDGITSFSAIPLRLASYLGMATAFLGFLYAAHAIYLKMFTQETIQGWTSMVIIILLLGGIQLLSIGLIGEYLSRVHEESKKRPLYVIEDIYENVSRKKK
ncbi:glycosyltransferase family 2 protein [Leptospira sp. GIMC2001]|uniref:glycosyltransferase family 2 protein n=1 Tax=Leptospira sp. GIMC2001 TaxID=1513297 RepID=UPI00234A31F9|nr:glycosyltransferase family 2 protein [Leptospira sp. GIMC2001]WCL47688.1 glycosyltransferase family 2 protein [Leptospira sp. GIMC2001]